MPNAAPIRSFAVSIVVLRVVEARTEVLLLERADSLRGAWCQVAGRIEPGEAAWQTALREVLEETGLRPDRFYSADVCEQFYEAELDCILLNPVFVGFVSPDQPVVLNAEHSAFRWCAFEDAIELVPFPGQRRLLREVHEHFVVRTPSEWLRINP